LIALFFPCLVRQSLKGAFTGRSGAANDEQY